MHFYIVSLDFFLNANWNQDDRIKKKKEDLHFQFILLVLPIKEKQKSLLY